MRITIKNPHYQATVTKLQELFGYSKPAEAVALLIELKGNALIAEIIAIRQPNLSGAASTALKPETVSDGEQKKRCSPVAEIEHLTPKTPKKCSETATSDPKITPKEASVKILKTRRSLSDAVE